VNSKDSLHNTLYGDVLGNWHHKAHFVIYLPTQWSC